MATRLLFPHPPNNNNSNMFSIYAINYFSKSRVKKSRNTNLQQALFCVKSLSLSTFKKVFRFVGVRENFKQIMPPQKRKKNEILT